MSMARGMSEPDVAGGASGDLRFSAHHARGCRVVLGLLWGVSMLFFARRIGGLGGFPRARIIEKIAMEGAAHMTLVFGGLPGVAITLTAPATSSC